MVAMLGAAGIETIVIDDAADVARPDAIFPNNWFCTFEDGTLCTFPMYAANRRSERRKDIIDQLMHDFKVTELEDWSAHEEHQLFLEGTGSMVFDHEHRMVYACISERTNALLVHRFAEKINYEPVLFSATDKSGKPVYHTNVLMCIGNGFCVACDSIISEADRETFLAALNKTGRELISISYEQVLAFAGNMLQLRNDEGEFHLVMSQSAHDTLTKEQLQQLGSHTKLLPVNIHTIETIGGGSARCMIAEIFLQRN
jgi:hypothetical protein